jgi:hypothetical protein
MNTTVAPPPEPAPFDPAAHFKARNEAEEARRTGKEPPKPAAEPVKAAETKPEPPPEPVKAALETPRLPRSVRREMNRLREEAAEARGRLEAYKELGVTQKVGAVPAGAEDPEPQLADFNTEADYYRALGRWDARQEVKKAETKLEERETQKTELEQLHADIQAAETHAQQDIKELFPDWDEVSKAAAEDEDAPEFVPADHPVLMLMLARSDMKARILYHFAKHAEEFQKMLDLTKNPEKQAITFARLEGRVEKLYEKKAAQAPAEAPKDRTHPAEAVTPAGRTAPSTVAESDARKPRPSTEVAARGGSAAPEEPPIGSAAWMVRRNQAERNR